MSTVGERIVEKAYESIERDLHGKKATRRALWHGVLFATIATVGLGLSIYKALDGSVVADAFRGGQMAAKVLPSMQNHLASIDVTLAHMAGALEVLTGNRKAMVCHTQEQAQAVKP